MRHYSLIHLFAFIMLLICSSTSANAFSEYVGQTSGWDVFESDDSCAMMMEYEGKGNTSLTLFSYVDGTIGISLNNGLWSTIAGQKYEITYAIDDNTYGGGSSMGTRSGTPGFVSKLDQEFLEDFATGKTFWIWMDEKIVDQLSLSGSANALTSVKKCLAKLKQKMALEDAEKRRWAHISEDPFGESKLKELSNNPPIPRGNPGLWISVNDYPSRALLTKRQGQVFFRLEVGADGRAKGCTISKSSGDADLDSAACANVTRRSRFNPATDGDGKPTDGIYESNMRWEIPD